MEDEEDKECDGKDDEEDFIELLHMNLEDNELEGMLNSAVNLSEVKKVGVSNMK